MTRPRRAFDPLEPPSSSSGLRPRIDTSATSATKRRVLIVDDEPSLRRVMVLLLAERFAVVGVASAAAALAALQCEEPFDAIVTDVHMPGMSGLAFHTALTRIDPSLARRVCFLTGNLDAHVLDYSVRSGCCVLTKPFRHEDLVATLDDLLA